MDVGLRARFRGSSELPDREGSFSLLRDCQRPIKSGRHSDSVSHFTFRAQKNATARAARYAISKSVTYASAKVMHP